MPVNGMFKSLDIKIGLLFLTLALVVALLLVPTISEDWRQSTAGDAEFFTVGPRFFPYLSAGIMAFLSLLLIFEGLRQRHSRADETQPTLKKAQLNPALAFMGIGTGYIAALPLLGVAIATPLCLAAFFWYFELRRWGWTLLFSIGVTVVIYYVFEKLMGVPLPMGFLEM
jgi:putative tricarboxylic transport membrane protein